MQDDWSLCVFYELKVVNDGVVKSGLTQPSGRRNPRVAGKCRGQMVLSYGPRRYCQQASDRLSKQCAALPEDSVQVKSLRAQLRSCSQKNNETLTVTKGGGDHNLMHILSYNIRILSKVSEKTCLNLSYDQLGNNGTVAFSWLLSKVPHPTSWMSLLSFSVSSYQ